MPSSEIDKPTPGVLLLGVLMLPSGVFLSPYLLAAMWPRLLQAQTTPWYLFMSLHVVLLSGATMLVFRWRRLGKARLARLIFERVPLLGGGLFAFSVLAIIGAIVEITFWQLYNAHRTDLVNGFANTSKPPMMQPDPILGRKARPGVVCTHRCVRKPGGILIFEEQYTLQDDGTRLVPQLDNYKNDHLAIFGCSYAFGIGSADDETFAARVAARWPNTGVYNFAYAGWGPGQTLLTLQSAIVDKISQPAGAAVYLFMTDHLNRISLSMKHVTTWTSDFPAFEIDPSGTPRHLGGFQEAYPWSVGMLDILRNEKFVQWSGINIPTSPGPSAIALNAALLAAARAEYQRKFPGNEFYVLIEPLSVERPIIGPVIAALLDQGIPIISAAGVYGTNPNRFTYPYDGHPTPPAWTRLAKWFVAQFPDGIAQPRRTGLE